MFAQLLLDTAVTFQVGLPSPAGEQVRTEVSKLDCIQMNSNITSGFYELLSFEESTEMQTRDLKL